MGFSLFCHKEHPPGHPLGISISCAQKCRKLPVNFQKCPLIEHLGYKYMKLIVQHAAAGFLPGQDPYSFIFLHTS